MTRTHRRHNHRYMRRHGVLSLVVAAVSLLNAPACSPAQIAPLEPALGAAWASPSVPKDAPESGPGWSAPTARVATWNIQTVGVPGSAEFEAAAEVLQRVAPAVVAIQEVSGSADAEHLRELAVRLGYDEVVVPASNPFGPMRNAVISRRPLLSHRIITAINTSGDPTANDITRYFVEAVIDFGPAARPVAVISGHWKSGTANADEFRRAVESFRVAIAGPAGRDPIVDPLIVMGDVNEGIDDPLSPSIFFSLPSGLPASFSLGADARDAMLSVGIVNSPFFYLTDPGELALNVLPALQLSGSPGTRPASGRRLDYILYSDAIATAPMGEVYNSRHEGLGGLPKFGPPPASTVSADASDHLMVFADVVLPLACYADCDTATGPGVLDLFDFLCFQDAFIAADPYACDCDTSAGRGVCDVFDLLCFQNAFIAGCP